MLEIGGRSPKAFNMHYADRAVVDEPYAPSDCWIAVDGIQEARHEWVSE
jgi:hypothetical protein